jgi:hypothetical protein
MVHNILHTPRSEALLDYLNRGLSQRTIMVCDMWNSGMAYQEIAGATNLPMHKVYAAIHRGKKAGVKLRPKSLATMKARKLSGFYDRQLGTIYQAVEALPEGVAIWLMETMPDGMTVAEYLAVFVVDAYNEETGA